MRSISLINMKILFSILLSFILFDPACSAAVKYKTDLTQLSEQKRDLFLEIQKTLDDWSGENEKLTSAQVMIESFIKSDPDFLPVYIEKARQLIMTGFSGQNDLAKFNEDALKILKEIQQKDPLYPKSYVLAGHAYINLGEFGNAKKSLDYAEKLKTTDPWLYNNWCDLFVRMKQYDKAIEYAEKALVLSKDNPKALVTAIYFISQYSSFTADQLGSKDIPTLIFKSFKQPQQRLRIAERLINAYDGRPEILSYAYRIIMAQKKETPDLEDVDFTLAEWLLGKGYMVTRNQVDKYDHQYSLAAEKILDEIKTDSALKDKIFAKRFAIALSDNNLEKARILLSAAEANGVSHDQVETKRAMLMWVNGNYGEVIKIYESLIKRDPSYSGNLLLMNSYARIGKKDGLATYYKMQVARNPTSAWTLGNYAGFLLFTMDDIDGAIDYGDKALAEMPYPLARNITSLAYLIKASVQTKQGDTSSAINSYKRAELIGYDKNYVNKHCGEYCPDIKKLWLNYPQNRQKIGT